jgi:hypothetical protein
VLASTFQPRSPAGLAALTDGGMPRLLAQPFRDENCERTRRAQIMHTPARSDPGLSRQWLCHSQSQIREVGPPTLALNWGNALSTEGVPNHCYDEVRVGHGLSESFCRCAESATTAWVLSTQ